VDDSVAGERQDLEEALLFPAAFVPPELEHDPIARSEPFGDPQVGGAGKPAISDCPLEDRPDLGRGGSGWRVAPPQATPLPAVPPDGQIEQRDERLEVPVFEGIQRSPELNVRRAHRSSMVRLESQTAPLAKHSTERSQNFAP
jgi:hypothetical protein